MPNIPQPPFVLFNHVDDLLCKDRKSVVKNTQKKNALTAEAVQGSEKTGSSRLEGVLDRIGDKPSQVVAVIRVRRLESGLAQGHHQRG